MADEKETVDIQRLIGEVAAGHRFLLKVEDPAIALIPMNQLILDSSLAAVHKQIRATIAEFHASLEKAEERAGSMLAQKVKESADQIREGLHGDIHVAGFKAREYGPLVNEGHRRPALIRWGVGGFVAATLVFGGGIFLGTFLHWRS